MEINLLDSPEIVVSFGGRISDRQPFSATSRVLMAWGACSVMLAAFLALAPKPWEISRLLILATALPDLNSGLVDPS
jgi:hypothetical protein